MRFLNGKKYEKIKKKNKFFFQHKNAAKIKNKFARTSKIIIIAAFSADRRSPPGTFVITPDSPLWAVDRTCSYRA